MPLLSASARVNYGTEPHRHALRRRSTTGPPPPGGRLRHLKLASSTFALIFDTASPRGSRCRYRLYVCLVLDRQGMKVPLDHKPALELGERNMSMHGNGKVEKVEGGSGNTEGKRDEVRVTAEADLLFRRHLSKSGRRECADEPTDGVRCSGKSKVEETTGWSAAAAPRRRRRRGRSDTWPTPPKNAERGLVRFLDKTEALSVRMTGVFFASSMHR